MGGGIADSGVFIRGENPESPQIQIGISGSLKVDMTGSPYVPKQGYPKKQKLKIFSKIEYHDHIGCKNNYKVWLNGQKSYGLHIGKCKFKGAIGLQYIPIEQWILNLKRF